MRICKKCSKVFQPKRIGGRHKGYFCSRECSTQFKRDNGKKSICLSCGKEFPTRTKNNKYCSKFCVPTISGKANYFWEGGKVEQRECVVCHKHFSQYQSQLQKTCSLDCGRLLRKQKDIHQEKNPNYRGGKNKQCKVCGKLLWECPSRNITYCSKECFMKGSFLRTAPRWQNRRWSSNGSKKGIREDLGIYPRSSWEANYARYLNFQKKHGYILNWSYENKTFEFPVKKGTRFYTPDFQVMNKDGTIEYHEVKGYMTQKAQTALNRMQRYYPNIKIRLIQKDDYNAISKGKALIDGWE